jgi:hypothetical protein
VEKFDTKFYSVDGLGFTRFLHIFGVPPAKENLEGSTKKMYKQIAILKNVTLQKKIHEPGAIIREYGPQ